MTINRRDTLKLSIAAYLATTASQAVAKDLTGTKVIVVGAGLAGLAAAQRLKAQDAEVVILEAGDYIGGRVRTDWSLGAPFEYGAGWIHGPSRRNPTKQLATQINARTFVTDDDNLEMFGPDGNALTDAQWERLEELYSYFDKKFNNPDHSGNQSVEEVLARTNPKILDDPLARWVLSAYFEFDIGSGIEDISARIGFETSEFSGDDVIFLEGYDKIIAPLAAGLDIRLNTPVSVIKYNDEAVVVDGEWANYAICTVPLGVLKSDQIEFDPPLPDDLQDAIAQVGFGTVTKIAFKFAEPFWDIDTQYFGIMTEPKGRWNYWINYRTFSSENILLGLSVGQYAPVADRMSVESMSADALDVLQSVWRRDVGTPQAALTTGWSQDPNFYGAYSYPQAGGSIAQFREFEKSMMDRLFFAGEHTIFDYSGTTHGALMSGSRAAAAILEL